MPIAGVTAGEISVPGEGKCSAVARPIKLGVTTMLLLMLQQCCFSGLLIGWFVAIQSAAARLWIYQTHHPAYKSHNWLVSFKQGTDWMFFQQYVFHSYTNVKHFWIQQPPAFSAFADPPHHFLLSTSSSPPVRGQQFPVCFKVHSHRRTCARAFSVTYANARANKGGEGAQRDAMWKKRKSRRSRPFVRAPLRLRGWECIKA